MSSHLTRCLCFSCIWCHPTRHLPARTKTRRLRPPPSVDTGQANSIPGSSARTQGAPVLRPPRWNNPKNDQMIRFGPPVMGPSEMVIPQNERKKTRKEPECPANPGLAKRGFFSRGRVPECKHQPVVLLSLIYVASFTSRRTVSLLHTLKLSPVEQISNTTFPSISSA